MVQNKTKFVSTHLDSPCHFWQWQAVEERAPILYSVRTVYVYLVDSFVLSKYRTVHYTSSCSYKTFSLPGSYSTVSDSAVCCLYFQPIKILQTLTAYNITSMQSVTAHSIILYNVLHKFSRQVGPAVLVWRWHHQIIFELKYYIQSCCPRHWSCHNVTYDIWHMPCTVCQATWLAVVAESESTVQYIYSRTNSCIILFVLYNISYGYIHTSWIMNHDTVHVIPENNSLIIHCHYCWLFISRFLNNSQKTWIIWVLQLVYRRWYTCTRQHKSSAGYLGCKIHFRVQPIVQRVPLLAFRLLLVT